MNKTVSRSVQQLRLPPRVEPRQVTDYFSHDQSITLAQCKFSLRPGVDECVEVTFVPSGRVPSQGDEELDFAFVRLEITNVDDPYACSIAVDGDRHLLVDLIHHQPLQEHHQG